MDERPVGPNEEAIDRVFDFRSNLAPDKQHHKDGDERDAEQRGEEHGECFRKGKRLEQASLLRFEREHRDKADGDDKESKEERAAYAFGGGDDDFDSFRIRWIAAF